jgi:hypothetical protein
MTLELGYIFPSLPFCCNADATPKHQWDTQDVLVRQYRGAIIFNPAQVDTPTRAI